MNSPSEPDLDPEDWSDIRALVHQAVDDMIDYVADVRERPVWTRLPDDVRRTFAAPLPSTPDDLRAIYGQFQERVLPFALGNTHPGFMGWVHGGGNIAGMLAEFLAASVNANLGGRDHAPVEVERQVVRWLAELIGLPSDAGGLIVTGSSMANFIGVLVARTAIAGADVRQRGVGGERLTAYTSKAAHACVSRAMDMSGLGSHALRLIPCDPDHRIDVQRLKTAIAEDRAAGLKPFMVVGNAGTVDVGAIDDLRALGEICAVEHLWFHVDGAFGALGVLSPTLRPRLDGLESADSVAVDLHKWAQVPYDAGCILVRDRAKELDTFGYAASYLNRFPRGLSAGDPWPCDLGPELSRGFRALKVWFTLLAYGKDRLGKVIDKSCRLAQRLAARIGAEAELELLGPVPLNIVCFRYIGVSGDLDKANLEIAAEIQESGVAAPSTTVIDGKVAIRAALFNHRTQMRDVDALVEAVLRIGRAKATA